MSRRQHQAHQAVSPEPRPPVRERIINAASKMFFVLGLRAVSVRHVADLAGTNSDAVLRYFGSKEGLVVHYLEQNTKGEELFRAETEAEYPGDPAEQLRAWIGAKALGATYEDSQGCALTSASMELMLHRHHPARRVIKNFKIAQRDEVARMCGEAGYREPIALADKLFMLAEGGEIAALTIGADGPGIHFEEAAEALIASHASQKSSCNSTSEVSHA